MNYTGDLKVIHDIRFLDDFASNHGTSAPRGTEEVLKRVPLAPVFDRRVVHDDRPVEPLGRVDRGSPQNEDCGHHLIENYQARTAHHALFGLLNENHDEEQEHAWVVEDNHGGYISDPPRDPRQHAHEAGCSQQCQTHDHLHHEWVEEHEVLEEDGDEADAHARGQTHYQVVQEQYWQDNIAETTSQFLFQYFVF